MVDSHCVDSAYPQASAATGNSPCGNGRNNPSYGSAMLNGDIAKTPGLRPRWQEVPSRNLPRSEAMQIIRMVSRFTKIPVEDIMGQSRRAEIARARHMTYLALFDAGAPYIHIGRIMGRDHSTVMHGVRKALGK